MKRLLELIRLVLWELVLHLNDQNMVSLYKKNFTMKSGILFFLSILLSATLWSQSNEDQLQRLMEDDPEGLNTIIAAEPNVQEAVLEAATQPELLSQLRTIQDRSRAAFESIVSPYSQETQQIFWDLTRYPNLVSRLAKDGKGTESGAAYVLRDYPEVIHARAKEANKYYYTLLVKIDDLEKSTNQDFNNLLNRYPRRTQDVFRLLLNNPEALSTLTQRNYTAETLADLYRNDANWITYRLRELNQERTQQSSAQLEDWRNSVQSDPEAVQELTESAQAYSKEYGYDDEYYGEDFDDDTYSSNSYNNYNDRQVVVKNYYYYNYPYWFGYPTWYRAPRWRPVPVWYDYGFVWRPNRPIVIVRMPSFYFVNWYFYRPWHHYRYARLSNCFVDYYYRYPRSYNTIVINVNTWKYRNRAVVHDDWLRDRDRRIERLREFGQFEQERRTYNRDNRSRELSQRDYLEKNESKYGRLVKVAPRNADRNTFPERENTVETRRRSDAVTQPRTREEAHQRERNDETQERTTSPQRRLESTTEPRSRSREEVQPRENPTRTPTQTPRRTETTTEPRTRNREEVQPRENPERNPTEYTPRRSTQPEQTRQREETQQREPVRREQPRTIERNPAPQQRSSQNQERTREPQVERSRSTQNQQQSRSMERPRSNNTQERSKSEPTKQEGSSRKRGGNDEK